MKTISILCTGSVLLLGGCTTVTVPVPAIPIPGYTHNSTLQKPTNHTPYQAARVQNTTVQRPAAMTPPATLTRTPPAAIPLPKVQTAVTRIPTPSIIPATATFTPPTLKPTATQKPVVHQRQAQQNSRQPTNTRPAAKTPAPHARLTRQPVSRKMTQMGQRIFQNETQGDIRKLVNWKGNRNFASLGIGQFIWYPKGTQKVYTENFPELLKYITDRGTPLPRWLAQSRTKTNPWPNRDAFLKAQNDRELTELRQFLKSTLGLQAEFMTKRLEKTLPAMLSRLQGTQRQTLVKNYQTVANSPGGLYALVDYLHFQGDGTNPAERYAGKGWGLLQVLQNMHNVPAAGSAAVAEFMRAADDTLVTRIANSPANKREARQLTTWQKRIRSYHGSQGQVAFSR